MIRAQTLSLRERLFVEIAKLSGANDFEIITFQILPNPGRLPGGLVCERG